ncbi:MAG: sulfatase-like hydrolase/transferase [Nitrospirae bacterium]|nr:sulfatase-like hydrolase/transferase [Nitrospirota bacterium]
MLTNICGTQPGGLNPVITGDFNSESPVSNLCDNNTSTLWAFAGQPATLEFSFGSPQGVQGYLLQFRSDQPNNQPTDWIFSGSNDNLTWVALDNQTGQSWSLGQSKTFGLNQGVKGAYQYYRLNITGSAPALIGSCLAEIQILAPPVKKVVDINGKLIPLDNLSAGEMQTLVPSHLINDINVILISIDTLRADALGCYGYNKATSPFIDNLSKSSILFKYAFTPIPWTLSAHTSMLTGVLASEHGIGYHSYRIPQPPKVKNTTISDVLHKYGIHTTAFVNPSHVNKGWGMDKGFDDWTESFQYDKNNVLEAQLNLPRDFIIRRDINEWLTESPNSKAPFFMFVHFWSPHGPYQPLKSYVTALMKESKDYNFPFDNDSIDYSEVCERSCKSELNIYTSLYGLEKLRTLYDAEIRYVDDQIKAIVDRLNELSLIEKTVIIITADHGEAFGEHNSFGHGRTSYNESARVPLLIYLPSEIKKLKNTLSVSHPVSTVSLPATILYLFGIENEGFFAKNLFNSVTNDASIIIENRIDTAGIMYTKNGFFMTKALIKNNYKYIYNWGDGYEEMFDYINDPKEVKDLITSDYKKVSNVLKSFRQFLDKQILASENSWILRWNLGKHRIKFMQISSPTGMPDFFFITKRGAMARNDCNDVKQSDDGKTLFVTFCGNDDLLSALTFRTINNDSPIKVTISDMPDKIKLGDKVVSTNGKKVITLNPADLSVNTTFQPKTEYLHIYHVGQGH